MDEVELYFLGTGAGKPAKRRNVTSVLLNLMAENGSCWLFDCGEGTQHQILNSPVKMSKIDKLFVTHLHGDHIFGIPGFLSSRSSFGGDTPLTVYGPKGIRQYIDYALRVSETRMNYELTIKEVDESFHYEDERFKVFLAQVDHRICSFGFRVEERNLPGALDAAKLKEEGVPSGPVYALLKQGKTVELPDGRIIRGTDYLSPSTPGRIVAIIGDTRKCGSAAELAKDADVLVHEATFGEQHRDLASDFGHSTAIQAAETANEAGAEMLVITHISARYQDDDVRLLEEAQRVFPNTRLAQDFWSLHIPRRK